jgi:hypothetical protein
MVFESRNRGQPSRAPVYRRPIFHITPVFTLLENSLTSRFVHPRLTANASAAFDASFANSSADNVLPRFGT